ncbi:MAG: pyridoxamine 5'-phosphate oxidase family protein, partial [Mycobacteriales bacterium]
MTSWPPSIDEILGGDQAVALAHVTPAGGVVVTPVTNFALRDPERGTVNVNSSVGMWRKLERMRDNPHVALAFHTRAHGFSERSEYVLVQGTASIPPLSDDDAWLEKLGVN